MTKLDDYVPMHLWAKDHWSMLAYAETVMVDLGGFQVGNDCRMRQGRRNFRVMHELCFKPRRIKNLPKMSMVMEIKHSTRLKDGTIVEGHDDWHCIQDMAACGFFTISGGTATPEHIEPGVILHLSPLGRSICNMLRLHKASGGNFGDFPTLPLPATGATI